MPFKFKGNKEATLYMNAEGRDVVWLIGLDGKYRIEPEGSALRGYWSDDHTFVLEISKIGVNSNQLHFEDERMIIETSMMEIEGKLENP